MKINQKDMKRLRRELKYLRRLRTLGFATPYGRIEELERFMEDLQNLEVEDNDKKMRRAS